MVASKVNVGRVLLPHPQLRLPLIPSRPMIFSSSFSHLLSKDRTSMGKACGSYVQKENYDLLIDSLSGTDHSWTSSTLKLCAALEKADRLILSANSSTSLLLEKIELLQSILKRGDAAVIKALEIVQAGKKAEPL